jgi:hypothetical protein
VDHESGHATRAEAERHFYNHEVTNLKEVKQEGADMHPCDAPGCNTFAYRGYVGRKLFKETIWLCGLHMSREVVPGIHPFKEGIEIWES